MKRNFISVQQYKEILNWLDALNKKLEKNQKKPDDPFLDNQELIQLMHISKKTSQNWRNSKKIAFSQIGSKIYYRMSDVQKLLDANYRKAYNTKRRNF